MDMRNAVADEIAEAGRRDARLVSIGADTRLIFKHFIELFPERFVDVGIAEATAFGVAAGLARSGRCVIVSAIAAFLLRRGLEQLRIDIAEPMLRVVILGVGGGISYGPLGTTHLFCEDLALARLVPNLSVLAPFDAIDAKRAFQWAIKTPGPTYIRLISSERLVPRLPSSSSDPNPLVAEKLHEGADALVLVAGRCVLEAVTAAGELAETGVMIGVRPVTSLRPFPTETIVDDIRRSKCVLTVEEHVHLGGLGATVAELMIQFSIVRPLVRLDLGEAVTRHGSPEALMRSCGVDAGAIVSAVRGLVASSRARSTP
ncbi:transketolase family protein [Bradyrhizobium lablabi]|uniref:transketolase family protein n=1 Tax=Bradyrhizobium lablabi TaxID=722472 RepID=UPI001BA7526C|nr:transketolase C-terminal domain-containing protein [Bradyrhizobium lablabi]MBR0696581.1 hypothetical protein [Bradyrhizobium lablabi]